MRGTSRTTVAALLAFACCGSDDVASAGATTSQTQGSVSGSTQSGVSEGETSSAAQSSSGGVTGSSDGSTDTTGGPVCDCASLPVCAEPGLNCGEMFPDGCCDEDGLVRHCLCMAPCDDRVLCCELLEGCPP